MQQYTTEWAKEYLRKHPLANSIAQHKDLTIAVNKCKTLEIKGSYWYPAYIGHWDCDKLGKMLEHPNGWENSLVTREDL